MVDNGSASAQSSAQLAPFFPHVRFLTQPKSGSYAARNLGVRESNGRTLAFIDADCRPRPDWIENGLAAFRSPRHPLVAGAVFPLLPPNPTLVQRFDARFGVPQARLVAKAKTAATDNLWMSQDLWQAASGYAGIFYRLLPPLQIAFEDGLLMAGFMWLTRLWSAREKLRLLAGAQPERR